MKRSLPLEYGDRVQPTRCQVAFMRRLLHFVTPLGVTPGGPCPEEAFRKARTFPGPSRDRQSTQARGWIQAAKAISRILFQRPCKVVIWCSSARGPMIASGIENRDELSPNRQGGGLMHDQVHANHGRIQWFRRW
jgi:hypothetical protein